MELNNIFQKNKYTIMATVAAVVLVAIAFLFKFSADNNFLSQEQEAELTEAEISEMKALEKIGKGRQSYSVSSTTEPTFTNFVIDPLDALKGETQSAEVKLQHDSPVETVSAELLTFYGITGVDFELVEEVEENGVYKSTWKAEWTSEGLLGGMNIIAKSGEDISRVEPRFVAQ